MHLDSPILFRFDMVSRVLRMVLAIVIGVRCYQLSATDFEPISRLMMGWNCYLLAMLQLTWLIIFKPMMHPELLGAATDDDIRGHRY